MKDLIQHESIHNNASVHWLTPPYIIEALGNFDLDPCASPAPQPWKTASTMWGLPEKDGLSEKWFGRVWLNPPYGVSNFQEFMERMALHGNGMALVFARTDSKWFQKWVFPYCKSIYFVSPRLSFYDPKGNVYPNKAGAPSILVAYSNEDTVSLKNASEKQLIKGSLFFKSNGIKCKPKKII